MERDHELALALVHEGTLLEDEGFAEWALRPRERLEWACEEARLALARDRTRGTGRSRPEAVIQAWDDCLAHDPTSEEAASALMRAYGAQRRHALVEATYERCRTALEELGLRISPALKEVHEATTAATDFPPRPEDRLPPTAVRYRDERRLVSVLFAELSGPVGIGARLDPEDLRQVLGGALMGVIANVEGLGGTVTSSRVRAWRPSSALPRHTRTTPNGRCEQPLAPSAASATTPKASRCCAGIETGQGGRPHRRCLYAPLRRAGEVVGVAAGLQSVAKAGSVLVGPVTRSATEGLFEWGPTEEVAISPGAKPLVGSYLERPKPRPLGQAGRRGLARGAPLMGRRTELAVLHDVLREATVGKGGVVLIAGEPGLVRRASCTSAAGCSWPGWERPRAGCRCGWRPVLPRTPPPGLYGLYQQLLTAWVGVAPEEGEDVVRPALERAMKAVFPARLLTTVSARSPR